MREWARRRAPHALVRMARSASWRLGRISVPTSGLSGTSPLSDVWGLDRGTPIDIFYLERFLGLHAADIGGRTLETGDARYARKFGREVTRADVLHMSSGNPDATIVGDLITGAGIPADEFDCVILTNTLLYVFDVPAALATCHRALRVGGVLLAHFNGLVRGQVSPRPWGPAGWEGEADYWRFTSASARRLCAERFGEGAADVIAYGNVRSVTASLYGLAAEELTSSELDPVDSRFELVICARAVRRA